MDQVFQEPQLEISLNSSILKIILSIKHILTMETQTLEVILRLTGTMHMKFYITPDEQNERTRLGLSTYISTLIFYDPKVLGKWQQTG